MYCDTGCLCGMMRVSYVEQEGGVVVVTRNSACKITNCTCSSNTAEYKVDILVWQSNLVWKVVGGGCDGGH